MKKIQTFFLVIVSLIGAYFSYKIFFKVEDVQSIKKSRIFLTGNIHGAVDISRLSNENFPEQVYLSGDDNLIILGDFGLIWDGSIEDEMLLDELDKKRYNILFVDGVYENFDLLKKYPTVRIYGGNATQIRDNIYRLHRGEIYLIDNKKFFVLGGGISEDKEYRVLGESYWNDEKPSEEELLNAVNNLKSEDYVVDYVLTYLPPSNDLKMIGANKGRVITPNEINVFLQEVSEKLKYKRWFHSYYHLDKDITRKHRSIYYDILELK